MYREKNDLNIDFFSLCYVTTCPWVTSLTKENPQKKMINIEIDSKNKTKTQWTLSSYRDHDLPLPCVL